MIERLELGTQFGQRVLIGYEPDRYLLKCTCGRIDSVLRKHAAYTNGCISCARQQPLLANGTRVGQRVVIGGCRVPRNGQSARRYLVRCDCGRERRVWHHDFVKGDCCGVCQRDKARGTTGKLQQYVDHSSRPEVARELHAAAQAWPQLWRTHDDSEMGAASLEACTTIGIMLEGMTLQEVAIVLGMSAENVRLIEAHALRKLRENRALRAHADREQLYTHWDAIWEAA